MSRCRQFIVEGRVQGVWFRESTRQQARRLEINGHAINLPDGRVEVVACGESAAIAELNAWLQHGPPMAQVTAVTSVALELSRVPQEFRTG